VASNSVFMQKYKIKLRKIFLYFRREAFEFFNSSIYSHPEKGDLKNELHKYLPDKGFFVEAGGHDGYFQSNTYYLERFLRWNGILIEPIPELYEKCKKLRKNSLVLPYALVDDDYQYDEVVIEYRGARSRIEGAIEDIEDDENKKRKAIKDKISPYKIKVPAKSLNWICEKNNIKKIDFLSIDVEGAEELVLKGINLNKLKPSYILIEANKPQEIDRYMKLNGYTVVNVFGKRDILYEKA
jgi:FkbM family methyltransferase